MAKNKFEFGTDFQELILQYTVSQTKGHKALELYEDSYFTLTQHAVIAYALKKYYKKKKRIAEEPYLREQLRTLYASDKEMFAALTEEDHSAIDKIVSRIYHKQIKDTESILEKIINFARYVQFKDEIEKVDINKYDSYEGAIKKLVAANKIGNSLEKNYGTFLVAGMPDRAYKRDQLEMVMETPFWQMNQLLNSRGFPKGAVIMIAGQAKRFKTGFMVNVARYLMRRKRRIIYFDFENGEQALTVRSEQGIINKTQLEVSSGDLDERLLKIFRKYRRIGAELVIKRMTAYKDTADDMQKYIDDIKEDLGMTFTDCIIDNPDLMASISGQKDEFNRIADAYVDVKELSEHNGFYSTWVQSHVIRDAEKRRGTKYKQNDLAKCIDKMARVDMAIGLQENEDEIENGVIRLEIMDQRHGPSNGKMMFWVDFEKQTMKEFTKKQVANYKDQEDSEDMDEKRKQRKKEASDL